MSMLKIGCILLLVLLILSASPYVPNHVFAQVPTGTPSQTPSVTPTLTPTNTLSPSATNPGIIPTTLTPSPSPTLTRSPLIKPSIVIQGYNIGQDLIEPGEQFTVSVVFLNTGQSEALNLVINFAANSNVLPTQTGGVHTVSNLLPAESVHISQPMMANANLGNTSVISSDVQVTYSDSSGATYGQSFTLSFPVVPYFPTSTPAPIPTQPTVFGRPFVTVQNYQTGVGLLLPGQSFTLSFAVSNSGQLDAQNLAITFEGSDFFPSQTTGVYSISRLGRGEMMPVTQPMLVNKELGSNKAVVTSVVKIAYNDETGKTFEEKYTLTFPAYNRTETPTPTVTPTAWERPQVLVIAYTTDVGMLYPGTMFNLDMQVSNLGNNLAREVNLITGGNIDTSKSSGTTTSGTPQASNSSSTTNVNSDVSNFAPVNSTNRVFLGDIPPQKTLSVSRKLIVNVGAEPGARLLNISFAYTDEDGNTITDNQVLSFLIYSSLNLSAGIVGTQPELIVGETTNLSFQITNLGKKSVLLGNLELSADKAEIKTEAGVIGSIESGGYFTADTKVTPKKEGNIAVIVKVNFLDDFGKYRAYKQQLLLKAIQKPTPVPTQPGSGQEETSGSFLDGILRFFRGLFGLESAPNQNQESPPGGKPPEVK